MTQEFTQKELYRYRKQVRKHILERAPLKVPPNYDSCRFQIWLNSPQGKEYLGSVQRASQQKLQKSSVGSSHGTAIRKLESADNTLHSPKPKKLKPKHMMKDRNESTTISDATQSLAVANCQNTTETFSCSSPGVVIAAAESTADIAMDESPNSMTDYKPLREGSLEPSTPFDFPIHLKPSDLEFLTRSLGEGQTGKVSIAKYCNVLVACKYRRYMRSRKFFIQDMQRELFFASRLSVCRFTNPYIGVMSCYRNELNLDMHAPSISKHKPHLLRAEPKEMEYFIVQRYYENGDLREYMEKLGRPLHPLEVLQLCISIFAALTDAHRMNVGIVDLKLENVLVDDTGSGWLTDFGSCFELGARDVYDMNEVNAKWTTSVAAPEMRKRKQFSKASDVFMAFVILAEMLTSTMSDTEFQERVLIRKYSGLVELHTDMISPVYAPFFPLLRKGLHNDPKERPTASDALYYFESLRKTSLEHASGILLQPSDIAEPLAVCHPGQNTFDQCTRTTPPTDDEEAIDENKQFDFDFITHSAIKSKTGAILKKQDGDQRRNLRKTTDQQPHTTEDVVLVRATR